MHFAGIVAEYNPFHNGHVYQVEQTRKAGATHIVAVMSGNVVQRGEVACFSKWTRAEAAVRGGVDLVVELPAIYVCSSAERFATGAVGILSAFGMPGTLSFGSECGDLAALQRAADAVDGVDGTPELRAYLSRGCTFANARAYAITDLYGKETAKILEKSNNVLGVEYIRALRRLGSPLEPFTVRRIGSNHDSKRPLGKYASASRLREICQKSLVRQAAPFMPREAYDLYRRDYATNRAGASVFEAERVILYHLRTLTAAGIAELSDVGEGLENRIYKAARQADSISDLLAGIKSKRYTESRVRRVVLCAALGITKELAAMPPAYIRPLAFNERGQELLKQAKKARILPICHSFAKLEKAFPAYARPEYLATELFRMGLQTPAPELSEYRDYRSLCLTSLEKEE